MSIASWMPWPGHNAHCTKHHYGDVMMGAIASQITSLTIVFLTVYSNADERKYESSVSLTFVRGNHRGPLNFPHNWPVTRKMFPFDDVIMVIPTQTLTGCKYLSVLGIKLFHVRKMTPWGTNVLIKNQLLSAHVLQWYLVKSKALKIYD